MTNISIGQSGEDIAERYLKDLRWKIIERNYRKPWGEIDIVAIDRDGTLVFVEVKAMRQSGNLTPEDNLTRAKMKKLLRTASLYANKSSLLNERGWRIDLIAIDLDKKIGEDNIRYYENIT